VAGSERTGGCLSFGKKRVLRESAIKKSPRGEVEQRRHDSVLRT